MIPHPQPPPDRAVSPMDGRGLPPVRALAMAVAILLAGVLATQLTGHRKAAIALGSLSGLAFLLAAGQMAVRARQEPTARFGWSLLAASMALAAVSQVLPLGVILRTGQPLAFPSPLDLLALLSLLLVMVGLLSWPLEPSQRAGRLRKGLDGLIFGLSFVFIGWIQGVGYAFHSSATGSWAKATLLGFTVANAAVLGTILYLGLNVRGSLRGPLGWFGAGLALSFLQSALVLPLGFAGRYYVGHPLDLLVLASALLVGLAPHSPRRVGKPEERNPLDFSPLIRALPYLPTLAAGFLGVHTLARTPEQLDLPLAWLGLTLLVLILARQVLAHRDLAMFSRTLEARVLERTRALEDAQALLLRTERMNAIASFGAGLAHDLNNLLTAIQTQVDLLALEAERGRLPLPGDLARIQAANARAAELTGSLMAFGRQKQEETGEIDLAAEVECLRERLGHLLPARILLQVECSEGPIWVRGSRGRLEQVIVNLVANARDAMAAGGRIDLRVRRLQAGGDTALLEVQDTGEGIPPELTANLFKPFFTTKAPGAGTGLGLACVKNLVEHDGGSISFQSRVGQGTVFQVQMPCRP